MRKPHTYWDEGITLVSSCTRCSPGCDNCWAMAMEERFGKAGEVTFHPDRLNRFNKKKPTVFSIWNDLHHEEVGHEFKRETYSRMAKHMNNTYLVLTKRPHSLIQFFLDIEPFWDMNNVWHGLTVCNQQEADEKIPIFMRLLCKKFISIEPLLKEINIPFNTEYPDADGCYEDMRHHIKQVVLGCETGAKARPMQLDWARSIAQQCKAANVPLFIKALTINGKPNHNIEQWPEDLRIRELVW